MNLPPDLEDELQKILCLGGYSQKKEKIYDVTINADGGWVLQLDKGADFRMGGKLPALLKQALEDGRKRKGVTIAVSSMAAVSRLSFC